MTKFCAVFLCLLLLGCRLGGQVANTANYQAGTSTHFAHGWDYNTILPMIKESGFGWIRDEIYWQDVEQSKGVYKIPPDKLAWIREVKKYGIKLLLIVNGGNKLYADIYDPEAYSSFVAFIAQELKDDVDALEILNEPANFGYSKFYGGTWNGIETGKPISTWVPKYVELLNITAKKVKAVNPTIKVVGLGSVPPVNLRQIQMGINKFVDGITDHPYSYRSEPEIIPFPSTSEILQRDQIRSADEKGSFTSLIKTYESQLRKYNGPKEIWITEFGFPTFNGTESSFYKGVSTEVQAKYLLRRYIEAFALNVEVAFQYTFKDMPEQNETAEGHFGIVDHQLVPKPAYHAVKRLNAIFSGSVPTKHSTTTLSNVRLAGKDSEIKLYAFQNARQNMMLAIWNTNPQNSNKKSFTNLDIASRASFTQVYAIDLLTGRKVKVPFTTGKLATRITNFEVPDHPLILTFE